MLTLALVLTLAASPKASAFAARLDAAEKLEAEFRAHEARDLGAKVLKELQAAVAARPKEVPLLVQLGRAQLLMDEVDDAAQTLESALALAPDDVDANLYRAAAARRRFDHQRARPCLTKVTELAPNDARGWAALGRYLIELREDEEGLAALQKAVTLDPADRSTLVLLSDKLIREKRGEESIALIERGLARSPSDVGLLYSAGHYYQDAGRYELARDRFQRAAKADPRDGFVRGYLVHVNQQLGDLQARDRWRKEVLALNAGKSLKKPWYQRDEFLVGNDKVEVFESIGSYRDRTIYEFRLDESGPRGPMIVLSSEMVTPDGGKQRKRWVVHQYRDLYAVFDAEPSYDEVKQLVIDILEGRRQPLAP